MTDRDTDRLLLEKAAKGAGLTVRHDIETRDCLAVIDPAGYWGSDHMYWNPLTDDGDALRLAVKLHICTLFPMTGATYPRVGAGQVGSYEPACMEPHDPDPYAATRRAIVRAAAALGGECAS